jgi:DNA-binding NarL/FixJ family response regulator
MADDNHRSAPAVRVLVVEDFEPFRRFVCSTLGKLPHLQIVAEASDGLKAVSHAKELQPDLILLDIGLPTFDGIEAARQIRTHSPLSKIMFVTEESAAQFVQEAFRIGAMAYVTKMRARKELLAAVDAVLDGRQFVSAGLQYQELPL